VNTLAAGTYNVTVTDANSCTASNSIVTTEPAVLALSETHTDVSCNGGSDGSIDITPSGGTGPFTYDWDHIVGTDDGEDVNTLAAGTYNITVTDANSCTATSSVVITEPAVLALSETHTDVSCNGGSDGSIDITPSGGTGPFAYDWDHIVGTDDGEDVNTLAAGTYNVTVTDANSCTASNSIVITEPAVLALSETHTDVSCNGGSDGSIDITPSGGTGPFTYDWDHIVGTDDGEDVNTLAAGTYNVTVTDANSCAASNSVVITEPAVLALSETHTDVSCNGGSDGSIDITPSGGTGPFTYDWDHIVGTDDGEDVNTLAAGTYNVTVTDANSCTAASSVVITEPAVLALSETHTDVSCNGGSDGSIEITPSGGTGPFTYDWDHIVGTDDGEDVNTLTAGTYNVTITDANSCTANTSVVITEPAVLALSETHTDVSCNGGSDGSIDITPSGGTGPFTYDWDHIVGTDDGEDVNTLAAGTYNVTVTDANSCTAASSVVITEPGTALGLSETHTDVSCNAGSDGSIDITTSGGTAPYTYDWNHIAGTDDGEDVNTLTAGIYDVTVTDNNSCTAMTSIVITEPAVLALSESHTNVSCNGGSDGSIDITTSGGTGPFTYDWDHIVGTDDGEDVNTLSIGTYNVTVTDANSCTAAQSVFITEPAALGVSETHIDVSCNGGNDGSINLTPSGGTAPFTYDWSHIVGTDDGEDVNTLSASSYGVTVTDANSCTVSLSVIITEPGAALSISETHINVSCNGGSDGSIDITTSGGTPAYTYDWSHIVGTDDGEDVNTLSAGTYIVTGTDANSCTVSSSIVITEPAVLALTETHINASCNGDSDGSIDITPSGGTGPFTYDWDHIVGTDDGEDVNTLAAGTYNVTVTDANSCIASASVVITEPAVLSLSDTHVDVSCNGGSDGSIDITPSGGTGPFTYDWDHIVGTDDGEDVSSLSIGTYNVTVTDANSCTANIAVAINEPAVLGLTETHADVSCSGGSDGSIDITPSGGTGPFTYDWDHIVGTDDGEDVGALSAGSFDVTVTDANSCTATISVTINEPSILTLSETHIDVSCNGRSDGSIDLTVSGATSPYTYDWDHIAGSSNSEDVTTLVAGTYTVTVTDNNSCSDSLSITITQPATLLITETHTHVSCNGFGDGSIDVTTTGGTLAYTYDWSHIAGTDDGEDVSSLTPATYNVTVTDNNGCTAATFAAITEPATLTLSETHINVSCNGNSDGSINATTSGGIAPFTYDWDHIGGSNNGEDVSGLSAGTYNMTVTDNNGCTASLSVNVTEPAVLAVGETHVNVSCNGLSDGSVDITASGGTTAYTYDWAHIAGTNDIEDLINITAGSYTVTVTDANSCTVSRTIVVTEPAVLVLNESHVDVSCNGYDDATIDLTPTGGTAPFTYDWAHIVGTDDGEDLSALAPGTYDVTVTDANGCTDNQSIVINEPAILTITETHQDVTCNGASNGGIDVTPAGGTTPYTYDWSHIAGSNDGEDASTISAGTYRVTITDANGCKDSLTVIITQPPALTLSETHSNVLCNGQANGSIDITVGGGVPSYTFDWDNDGTGDNDDTEDLSGLVANTYSVTVTDQNSCTISQSINVTQPAVLTITMSKTNTTCVSLSDGTATATPAGGTTPYSYLWSTTGTTQTITNLTAGWYYVTVTDTNGCTNQDSIEIPFIPLLTVNTFVVSNYNGEDISCFGFSDGFAVAAPSGGSSPFSYAWSNGGSDALLQNVPDGTYTVTVTDNRGCTMSDDITLNEPPAMVISFDITSDYSGRDISCFGRSNGSVEGSVTNGISPYSYSWSTGSNSDSIFNIPAGNYTLTVTDDNGCTLSNNVILTEPDSLTLSLLASDYNGYEISCKDANDGSLTSIINGGTYPFFYSWSNASSDSIAINLVDGYYELTLTDNNGCTAFSNYIMDEPPVQSFTVSTAPPSDCGASDGIILVDPSGGIGQYQYSLDGSTYQSDKFFTGLLNGTYSVYMQTSFGTCTKGPKTAIIDAAETPIIDNVVVINPTTGVSTDGGILVEAKGNGLAFEYRLNGVTGWQSSNLFSSLVVGTYTLQVRYVSTNCIATQSITLVAGGGVVGSPSSSQICAQGVNATDFVTTFYIPMPENQIYTAFYNLYYPSCGGALDVTNPIISYNSIGIVENGTVIYYDHWEDGYEINLTFPINSTTEVWGDNDTSNGVPPGFTTDYLSAGDIIILQSNVDTLTRQAVIDFDGGDKFASKGDLYYSRMVWPTGPNSFLAGASEVYPQAEWGNAFEVPVGVSTNVNSMFDYVGATIMASDDNTSVTIINGSTTNVTLNEGESYLFNGTLNAGAQINSDKPIQVQLITGDICASYETRFFSLTPTNTWTGSYYNPVGTRAADQTVVHLYNPNAASITVTVERPGGITSTVNVAAGGTATTVSPDGEGTHIYTTNGDVFYALATTDDGGTQYDWGYALLPSQLLSGQITLVGFAPGENPLAPTGTNANPIWITGDHPTGSTFAGDTILIYVDFNGDGGTNTDPFGTQYDVSYVINELEQLKIYDPDGDQTGMRIWVGDLSDAIIAGAYGQDPSMGGTEASKLDLGTGLFNKIPFSVDYCVNLYTDFLGNDLYDECDEIIYTMKLKNTGTLPLTASTITINDTLPTELTYIENSTNIITQSGVTNIPDDTTPDSPFPLDENGYLLVQLIQPGDSITVQYTAKIDKSISASFVQNTILIANANTFLNPEVSFPVQDPAQVSLLGLLPDTTLDCSEPVPEPPYRDTCLSNIFLDQKLWTLNSVSSEDTAASGDASNAFDGSSSTNWVTKSTDTYPHELVIDLGSIETTLQAFRYFPVQDSVDPRIGGYELYISDDGISWGAALDSGSWDSTSSMKSIDLMDTSARYIRLVALNAAEGGNLAGAAEINILVCDQDVVFAESSTKTSNGSCSDIEYTITRDWTVTNHCGNTATQSRNITFQDTTAPIVFGIPADITVKKDSVPPIPNLLTNDNCDTSITSTVVDSTYMVGCTTFVKRKWSAIDVCGNVFKDSQLITEVTCDENCSDGIDNDLDGLIDCADPDCYRNLRVNAGVDTTLCDGDAYTLYAIGEGGDSTYSYAWDNGLGAGASQSIALSGTTTYNVTVTDGNSCTNTDQVTITANTNQFTSVLYNDIVGSDDSLMQNDDSINVSYIADFFNLEAITLNNNGSVKFLLTGMINDTIVDNGGPFRYPTDFGPLPWTEGTYYLTILLYPLDDAKGKICDSLTYEFYLTDDEICDDGIDNDDNGLIDCADTSSCRPNRPSDIVESNAIVCEGTDGETYSVPAVPGAISYTWTVPAGGTIISGQGSNSIVVNWTTTGGDVCVTAYNGYCTSLIRCETITIRHNPVKPMQIFHR
ncbi:MAG: hypothetical protein HKN92_06385, partial [Chitinophagales bacterium]|nr:hypothetical protein [Chitinophagales bacterium]